MNNKRKQSGLTLTELVVTIAIAAILMAVAVPAAKRLAESLSHSAGAYGLISAALSNARAIATSQGKYAGLRFQQAADGRTYMVFIINDEDATGLVNGFRAIDGRKPIALPEEAGVLDGMWVKRNYANYIPYELQGVVDNNINSDADLMGNISYLQHRYFEDASTFSIVFSPAGKVVTTIVYVRNKDGIPDTSLNTKTSTDSVFNKKARVDNKLALLYQDDYDDYPPSPYSTFPNWPFGIGPENSRQKFIIYNKKQLAEVNSAQRWSAYLSTINPIMVSPYTGELLGGDQN